MTVGKVYKLLSRNPASYIDLLRGFPCTKPGWKPGHFTWLDENETRDIFPGDYVVMCESPRMKTRQEKMELVWCFYHVLYCKKFIVLPDDSLHGVLEHFMKPLRNP